MTGTSGMSAGSGLERPSLDIQRSMRPRDKSTNIRNNVFGGNR
jgi:hypothetical protein